jgi:hypothetical protein
MDWTATSIAALIATVFVMLIVAVWQGHKMSTEADERMAMECITKGGNSMVIGGQRHCIVLNNSRP